MRKRKEPQLWINHLDFTACFHLPTKAPVASSGRKVYCRYCWHAWQFSDVWLRKYIYNSSKWKWNISSPFVALANRRDSHFFSVPFESIPLNVTDWTFQSWSKLPPLARLIGTQSELEGFSLRENKWFGIQWPLECKCRNSLNQILFSFIFCSCMYF